MTLNVLSIIFLWSKFLKSLCCRASKDKHTLAKRVCDLTLLETTVLHRRQQILKPTVFARVEFIPEDHWYQTLKYAIAYLVKGSNQITGLIELREIKLHPTRIGIRSRLPEHSDCKLLNSKR